MADIDWSRFLVRIDVKSTTDSLYRAWGTRKGLEYWFLRECLVYDANGNLRAMDELIQAGDRYVWRWHGYPDATTEEGVFMTCDGKSEIQFQFGKAGRCTVRIHEMADVILVDLVQDQIPETESGRMQYHVGCRTGWTFYLANLKSLQEGGIDLRNKNANLREMLNS